MKAYKILCSVLILLFLVIIATYSAVIIGNIPVSSSIPLFNWNPPPSKNEIPLALAYPETFVMSFPNGTLVMADMLLTFNGELAENTLVQVENASSQIPPLGHVSSIAVGFEEAFLPNQTTSIQQGYTWGGGAVCAVFSRTQPSPPVWSNLTVYWENNVTFPVAGDYSPSVFITFDDGSSPVQYTYSQIKVHVISASEVNAQNMSRLTFALTIALLGFSFIEGFMVIYEILSKEETKKVGSIPSQSS